MKLIFKYSIILLVACLPYVVKAQGENNHLPQWALGPFIRPVNVNPIISPDTSGVFFDPIHQKMWHWESNDTFNPAATVKNGKIYVLYRSEDNSGKGIGQRTSRIGIAESTDGLTMKRFPKPVFYPADDNAKEFEWNGGCEDPRVAVTSGGTYVMLYTEWNGKVPRLAAATSRDLLKWKKGGPVFRQAYNGRFFNMATKSASILTKITNGKQVITKINGKYWMYWGEQHVYAATSTDLVNWLPLINKDSTLKILFSPRAGYFDSMLTECGPPSLLTDKGIVLLYNGKNSPDNGDKNYATNTYCGGQALFSLKDPTKLITRLDKPYLGPKAPFEKSGQYPAGTVFTEGLVYFHAKWYLYYGCADSRVAVAVYNPSK
jgi:beta-1,2-mannosidase